MLKTLDVLIGLSVVMLLVSMVVTAMTQCVLGLRNSRGRHLLKGIEAILVQIDPNLKRHAEEIATAVLTHPLIGPSNGKLAGVVFRGELVRALMELATVKGVGSDTPGKGVGPDTQGKEVGSDTQGKGVEPETKPGLWWSLMIWLSGEEGPKVLAADAKTALAGALRNAGIDQPDKILENIYATALKLEATNPELSTAVRHTTAIIQEAPGVFVSRLNSWFDNTMDRVTEAFVYNARKITVVCSLIVAVVIQLDSIDLLKKLSTDDELRKAMVGHAAPVLASYDKKKASPAETEKFNEAKENLRKYAVTGYELWPEDWKWEGFPAKVPGILLTTILLSLGAPFWFNALKNLVNLRPLLAGKDDAASAERATAQARPAVAATVPASASEQGDLSAAG